MNPKLVFLSGELKGFEFELGRNSVAVGRHHARDLVVPEDIVSRHHATLLPEDGRCVLRDENSTNGTFINDRKIQEQVLQPGDVIEFGLDGPKVRFETESLDQTQPVRPRRPRTSRETLEESEPGQALTCPHCENGFRVPVRELASPTAVFVIVDDEKLPEACPHCGRSLNPAWIDRMLS